ncbi:HD-GYP domain-containing protein [Geobacter sp. DSM 9736]|uniref:HD-GYP domain-containing protein n=1 Tax=Geobacter sp. DSM 9736 TaxID=1277350 RepID=UPI000B4FEBDF|nr:HD domain-containing phosphohydrolase [Geobacter sp. DSM 9736]SNB45217.1 HDIG domain-containing protein [Geobacter sp. DSM 9736]
MEEYAYKPVIVNCIIPEAFPPVALFTKGSGGNYILYKNSERPFTPEDHQRLARGGTKCMFVHTEDFRDLITYLEENLARFLASDEITEGAKNVILCQISTEYIAEMMEKRTGVDDKLIRCRRLIRHLMAHVTGNAGIFGLMKELASEPRYILEHSVKVAALTMLFHDRHFSIEHDEMIDIGVGGILHDIGMMFLCADILDKPDALSDVEYNTVKKHPVLGHEFLQKVGVDSEVALTVVKHHHEHWDGSGYPGMLRANAIPRSAQVAAICDIYCALTSNRPYRKASSHEEALRIMKDEAGRTFNDELFRRFADLIGN